MRGELIIRLGQHFISAYYCNRLQLEKQKHFVWKIYKHDMKDLSNKTKLCLLAQTIPNFEDYCTPWYRKRHAARSKIISKSHKVFSAEATSVLSPILGFLHSFSFKFSHGFCFIPMGRHDNELLNHVQLSVDSSRTDADQLSATVPGALRTRFSIGQRQANRNWARVWLSPRLDLQKFAICAHKFTF